MNDLLHEVLTEVDYKNLTRFNLLLSHYISSNDFEETILHLLNDVFEFNHGFFLRYDDSGYLEKLHKYNVDKDLVDDCNRTYKNKDLINQVLIKHNYKLTSEQVIVLSDIFNDDTTNMSYLGGNYYHDIYIVLNDKGDGIRILREKSQGEFTKKDMEICNYLCKVLSSHYKIIQENRKIKFEVELMNKNKDNMNFGFMMLSRDFKLINYNKLALCYCNDLTGSYDINNAINEFKSIIDKEDSDHLQNNYTNTAAFHKSFNSFIVEIIPTILVNHNNKVDHYYMVYIYNKIWFNRMQNKLNYTKEKYNLTNREKEIVSLVSKGLSNKEIAEKLFISIYTVKEHMKNISKKMNVHSRTGIISKLAM